MSLRATRRAWAAITRAAAWDLHGFSLVEVLVALVVISLGLLGIAGLQLAGMRGSTTSTLRTTATQLAYDATDRMRANPTGVAAGNYDNQAAPAAVPGGCLSATGCTTAQISQLDLFLWQSEIARKLPGGAGVICRDNPATGAASAACDGNATDPYRISVTWNEQPNMQSTNVTQQTFLTYFLP